MLRLEYVLSVRISFITGANVGQHLEDICYIRDVGRAISETLAYIRNGHHNSITSLHCPFSPFMANGNRNTLLFESVGEEKLLFWILRQLDAF